MPQPHILGIIKPRILEAVAGTRQLLDDDLPVAVREIWTEAICDLLLHVHTSEGRPARGGAEAEEFRRLPFQEKQKVASQINLSLDDFVRLVRGAQLHERSSTRPPPALTTRRPISTSRASAQSESATPARAMLGWAIPKAARLPKFGK